MNQVKKDILKAGISGFLTIVAFFLWYIFAVEKYSYEQEWEKTKYIEIKTTKNAIKILSIDEGIDIIVNGQKSNSGSIELK